MHNRIRGISKYQRQISKVRITETKYFIYAKHKIRHFKHSETSLELHIIHKIYVVAAKHQRRYFKPKKTSDEMHIFEITYVIGVGKEHKTFQSMVDIS